MRGAAAAGCMADAAGIVPFATCSYMPASAMLMLLSCGCAEEEKAKMEEQKAALEPLCRLIKDILGDKVCVWHCSWCSDYIMPKACIHIHLSTRPPDALPASSDPCNEQGS